MTSTAARSVARLTPAVGLLVVGLVAASFAADRATAPATAWWAWVGCAVFGPLLVAGRRTSWVLAFGVVLTALAIVLFPRQGAVALAVPSLLFAVAVALGAADLLERDGSGALRDRLRWLAVAFSAQLVANADRLWDRAGDPTTLLHLAVAPAVAGWALAEVGRLDRSNALTAGCLAFAAGPGWSLASCVALALFALAAHSGPKSRFAAVLLLPLAAVTHEPLWVVVALGGAAAAAAGVGGWVGRSGRVLVAGSALGALLAAALPFARSAPLEAVYLGLAAPPGGQVERVHTARDRPLSATAPTVEWDLTGAPVGAVVLDAFLIDAAALPCGQRIATVRLESAESVHELELRLGHDLFDWAVRRPDVARLIRCREARAFSLWLPSVGRFFGAQGRIHLAVEPPIAAQRLRITRADDLPADLRLVLRRVVTER